MATPIYKIILFLKRKPGLSVQGFRDYYENHHRLLGEKYSTKAVKRYVRRYVEPVGSGPAAATADDLGFDVITEIWLDDRAMFEQVAAFLAQNTPPADVLEDELKLFDRERSRVATVIEYESDVSKFP